MVESAALAIALALVLALLWWGWEQSIRAAQAEDHAAALRRRLRSVRSRAVRNYQFYRRERSRRRALEAEIVSGQLLKDL